MIRPSERSPHSARSAAEQATLPGSAPPARPGPGPASRGRVVAGRYRLLRRLGQGAIKVVYAAHDVRLDRDVALSELLGGPGGAEARARVEREARVTARLGDHPNIVTIHDAGEDDGVPYFVARLMRGGSLADRIAGAPGGRLEIADAVRIGAEIAEGLAHAHAGGVLHRDVKPDNVWLDAGGRAALGDFGVARDTGAAPVTAEGLPVGTPLYMSPEQIRGDVELDGRTDLYALGVTLYEMLCGRPPFAGEPAAVALSHLVAPPAPPWEHREEIPRALGRVVVDLLAKHRADRPASAGLARDRLLAALHDELPEDAGDPVVGRDRELELGRRALARALSGTGGVLAFHGESGIGKTTVVREIARTATGRGAAVLWSTSEPDDGAPPYWAWAQVFRELPAATGRALPPELEHLLPDQAAGAPEPPPGSAKEVRFRLYAATAAALRAAAAERPLVVVLDDLQWADAGSVALLARIAEDLSRLRVLVLATYRSTRGAGKPLETALTRLKTNRRAETVALRGLGRDDVAALLERSADVRSAPLAGALAEHTRGNPLFIAEIVRMLVSEGRLEGAGRDPQASLESVPSTVLDVVEYRLGAVGPQARRALEAAAVQGAEFDLGVVAGALGCSPLAAREALEEAAREHLVAEDGAASGAWSFAHGIVRQAVYQQLEGSTRGRLHAAVAHALEGRAADRADDVGAAGELAHHYGVAAEVGLETRAAVAYARLAADRAAGLHAYDLAVEHLARAERILAGLGDAAAEERCDVLLRLAEARECAGDVPRAKLDHVAVHRLASRAGDARRMALAARGRARWADYGITDHEAVALLDTALARLPADDDKLRAELLALLGTRLDPVAAQPRREELIGEAVAMAERLGDRDALPMLLIRKALINFGPGREAVRAAAAQAAIALSGDGSEGALWGRAVCFTDALAAGDVAAAGAELDRYAAGARPLKRPYYDWFGLVMRGTLEGLGGRLEAAERIVEEAHTAIGALEDDSEQEWTVQRLMLARLAGRAADAPAARVHAYAHRYPDLPMWRAMAAWIDAEQGRGAAAAEAVRVHLPDRLDRLDGDPDRPTTLLFLADAVATLGDAAAAAPLLEALRPEAARIVVTDRGWAAWGPAARALGRLAAVTGDADAAARWFDDAIASCRRWDAPAWLVLVVANYARAVPGAPALPALLAEAEAIAAERGLVPPAERLRAAPAAV